jgi:hypothetical protein
MRMKNPKFVKAYVDRHGHPRYYVRRRGYPRTALHGLPNSPSFMAEYEAALGGPIVVASPRALGAQLLGPWEAINSPLPPGCWQTNPTMQFYQTRPR